MAEEKEKAIAKDQETIESGEDKQAELSEKDLEKAAGGAYDAFIKIEGMDGDPTDEKYSTK